MYKAETAPGQFTEAQATGQRAACPACKAPVLSRCGAIVANHWAHVSDADCDPWAQPMTDWHYDWQKCVPLERREVVMGPHRADAMAHDGRVIEFQHSAISADEISEREAFYGDMVWVFDARDAVETRRLTVRDRGTHESFRWSHARKSITLCTKRIYLDLGHDTLFMPTQMYPDAPIGGWGYLISHNIFRSWAREGRPIRHLGDHAPFPARLIEDWTDHEYHYELGPCVCPACVRNRRWVSSGCTCSGCRAGGSPLLDCCTNCKSRIRNRRAA